jgi:rare lipoprotein A
MVWGFGGARVAQHVILPAALVLASVVAPQAAYAGPQGGVAQVAYFDPTIINTQGRTAALGAKRQTRDELMSPRESYPETRMAYAPAAQTRAPQTTRPVQVDPKDFVKIGAPYKQNGTWYVPAMETDYDETGVGSWYGAEFHGKTTSNGEVYDMESITAAHPTLPLPSIVEVTNLENGKKLKVRVNDRGPFVKGRLIDLSPAAAKKLGYYGKGSAKVRVRYVGAADGVDAPMAMQPSKPQYGLQSISYSKPAPYRAAPVVAKVGAGARIAPVEQGGATLYRVLVGPLADEASVTFAKAEASRLGVAEPRTVTLN